MAAVGNDIIKATVDDVTACEILCDVHSSCVRLYYDAATKTCYVGLLEHYEENVTNVMSKVVAQQLLRKCHGRYISILPFHLIDVHIMALGYFVLSSYVHCVAMR